MVDTSIPNHGPLVVAVAITMIVFPTITTILRVWSRAITSGRKTSLRKRYWWDDWLAFASLPFGIALSAIEIKWTTIGLGKHLHNISILEVLTGLKLLFHSTIFYNTACSLTRMSCLFFYLRIFGLTGGNVAIAVKITMCCNAMQWLAIVFLSVFQCKPIRKQWDPFVPGTCLDYYTLLLGYSAVITFLDVVVLILPLPILWTLKMKPMRKVFVTILFLFGWGVVLISVAILVVVQRIGNRPYHDPTWNIVPEICLLLAEPAISLVSINIPNIYTLCKRGVNHGIASLFTDKEYMKVQSTASPQWPSSHTPVKQAKTVFQGHASNNNTSIEKLRNNSRGSLEWSVPHIQLPQPTNSFQSHTRNNGSFQRFDDETTLDELGTDEFSTVCIRAFNLISAEV